MTRSMRLSALTLVALCGAAHAGPVSGVSVIARQGQIAPGSGGLAISSINAPFMNGLGQVGFTGNLTGQSGAVGYVWFNDGVTWMNTDAVGHTLTGQEATMGIGNDGNFIYSPSTDGNDSVWTRNGLLLQDTDAAPSIPGQFATFNSRPRMTADSSAIWVGGISSTQGGSTQGRVLWRADSGGNITPIFRSGDVIGGFEINATGVGFGYDVSLNGNHHIHRLNMANVPAATNEFIYVDGNLVLRQGDVVGGGDPTTWSSFGFVTINNNGNYVFSGVTAGGVAAENNFIAVNGAIDHRRNTTIDGVSIGTGATVRGLSMNSNDEVAFIWQTGSGASSNGTLFWGHSSDLAGTSIALLSTGDLIDTTGDGIADASMRGFLASAVVTNPGIALTDNGIIYAHVDLVDLATGGISTAMLRIVVPAPGAAALMGFTGLGALRRRR